MKNQEEITSFDPESLKESGHTLREGDIPESPAASADIGRLHLNKLRNFREIMSNARILNDMSREREQDILSGQETYDDLPRLGLSINGTPVPKNSGSLPSKIPSLDTTLLDFWRINLENVVGLTEEKYKEIDVSGKRNDLYKTFSSIFATACTYVMRDIKVPSPLLIEELITTLNRKSIANFPCMRAACEAWKERDSAVEAATDLFKDCKISVTCLAYDKIAVAVTLKQLPLPEVTEIRFGYRLNLKYIGISGLVISYNDIQTTIALRGTDKALTEQTLEEFCRNPENSYRLSDDLPNIYPTKEGLILSANLEGFHLDISSMLSSRPNVYPTSSHNATVPRTTGTAMLTYSAPRTSEPTPNKAPSVDHETDNIPLPSDVESQITGRGTDRRASDIPSIQGLPNAAHASLEVPTSLEPDSSIHVYTEHDYCSEYDSVEQASTISKLFSSFCNGLRQFFAAVKNLFCCCIASARGDVSASPGHNVTSGSTTLHDEEQRDSSSIDHGSPNRQNTRPAETRSAMPSSSTSSVNVHPVSTVHASTSGSIKRR